MSLLFYFYAINKYKYSHELQHIKSLYIYHDLQSLHLKKLKRLFLKNIYPKVTQTFCVTQLFQSLPANLPVEQLTSLWGREWVPQMHLSPPERGYWPKTDEKIIHYLKALKRIFLTIESSCSSTSNLNQWLHEGMTTMNASFWKRQGTKYLLSQLEWHASPNTPV